MVSKSAQIANAANKKLEQFMPALFPSGVALGLFLPGVFAHLRPFVILLFAMMTLSGALRLTVAEFGKTIRSPLPIIFFMLAIRIALPLIAHFASSLFFRGNTDIITGFVLLFSGSVAVSSFIWTGMFNGNKALCLTLILLDTMLAPVAVPFTLSILMGETVALDMTGIAISLVFMVVIPTIVGVTINETSKGKIPAAICPYLTPLSKIFLMLVIAANSSAVAHAVRLGDPTIWKIAALCAALSTGVFLAARLICALARCKKETLATLVFTSGLKNVSASTTIAVTFFPEDVALP
ncbi:MAG: hypothetical protein FWE09_08170, partial [Treponema sp.]|nr:hypothetical protein [Treponema sp.]